MSDGFSDIGRLYSKEIETKAELPKVPDDILDWIKEVRPKAEGKNGDPTARSLR